eukprot:1876168-Rhodomonas_salina.1
MQLKLVRLEVALRLVAPYFELAVLLLERSLSVLFAASFLLGSLGHGDEKHCSLGGSEMVCFMLDFSYSSQSRRRVKHASHSTDAPLPWQQADCFVWPLSRLFLHVSARILK